MEFDKDLTARQEARELARRAETAQRKLAELSQSQLDAIVEAVAKAFAAQASALAEMAVQETGFGNAEDKRAKNLFASQRVAEAVRGMRTVGVLREVPEKKLWEIGVPVGVIAAIIPSGIVGVLFDDWMDTHLHNGIVVAVMASFCAWELLHTAMPKFVPRFAVYAGMCGAAIVLGAAFGKSELVFKIAAYVLFVTMFVEMMISFHKSERIPFQDLALVFTAGIVIPWMLSSLVRLGLNDPKAPYLLLPFVITWLSDSGAFFVGRSLGKTKLAPALSPHKTVEGCVGGFVCAIAAAMLYGLVLHLCGYRVQIGLLAIYGFFGSLAGQTGDLAFSAIKREHGVKDYSNLLPGHGGMLDRFDSTIFTAPMLELLVLLAPAIAVVAQ